MLRLAPPVHDFPGINGYRPRPAPRVRQLLSLMLALSPSLGLVILGLAALLWAGRTRADGAACLALRLACLALWAACLALWAAAGGCCTLAPLGGLLARARGITGGIKRAHG